MRLVHAHIKGNTTLVDKKTEKAAFDKAKKPQPKKPAKLSAGAKAFDKAFAAARSAGKKEFTWRGKRYHTRLKK